MRFTHGTGVCTFVKSIRTLALDHDPEFERILSNIRKINEAMKEVDAQDKVA